MARSMNGINNIEVNNIEFPDGSTISSASNLVQLDTNNVFTGNTAYENNLPTSNVNPLVGDINNNTMLNKFSADKLYIGNAEISECFDGASITGRDITLTRVDGENDEVISIPETSLSTCVLKTTDQEIDGEKTFVEIPKIKIPTGGTLPTPTDNAELTTKSYVDTTAVLKTTAQEIDGEKTFVDIPKIKIPTGGTLPTPTDNAELTTKSYVDTTAVLKTTAQEIGGTKTFVDFPEIKLTDAVPPAVPDPTANNQFATKKYVDDNGGTPTNMVTTDTIQNISGLKGFSNQRPKAYASATTTTATSQELITKGDGDGAYAPKNTLHGFSQKQHTNDDQIKVVIRGNPSDTNPNSKGGLIHSFLTCYVSTYGGDYAGVSLDFSVVGEWNNYEYDKGVAIARAKWVGGDNGNYAYDLILRAPINGQSVRFIQNFTISYHTDKSSTLESCNGKYIDTGIENDNLYSYTIVVVNSSTHTTNHAFYLNRTVNGTGSTPYERGTSCITAQLFN